MNGIRAAHLSCLLALLTVASYLPLWQNEFIDYDDEIGIIRNANVADGLTLRGLEWALTNEEPPYHVTVAVLTLQFDAEFFSTHSLSGVRILSPAAFHGHNLFWHTCNALMLFVLLRRLTGAMWRSFLVACLFAIHPMHVESVAWAIERKDVLMCFFGLSTVYAYVRYVEKPTNGRYIAMIVSYTLSMLSKPLLMTLPFVLLLLDYWPLRRIGFKYLPRQVGMTAPVQQISLKRLFMEKLSLFGIAAIFALETMRMRSGVSFSDISLTVRLMNALAGYGWYVTTSFWPTPLVILYPHPYSDWSASQAIAGAGILIAITTISFVHVRCRPWLIVGWLWFVVTLTPVSGLAQGGTQAWADRFSYWPHIGLFIAVVWGLHDIANRFGIPRRILGIVWGLVIGCLAVLTWIQVGYWRDSITVWEHALECTQNNGPAHQHLSSCYRRLGRLAEADFHLAESERIHMKRIKR